VDNIEDDRDLDPQLARSTLYALDLVALAVDQHDPARPLIRITAQRLGECIVDHLRHVVRSAGFVVVRLRIDVLVTRVAAPRTFLSAQFTASPVAANVGALTEPARAALFDDIERRLGPYTDDTGWAVPFEAHTVIGYRNDGPRH
jgi:hypothetical protein